MLDRIRSISQFGVTPGIIFSEKKKLTLINSTSILMFVVFVAFFFISERRFMYNNAIMAFLQMPPLLFNYRQRTRTGTLFFIYANLFILLYLTVMYGYPLGAGFAMICWGLIVGYVFDRDREMLPHILIGGAGFVYANYRLLTIGPIEPIPFDLVGTAVIGICFFTPVLISRIYKAEHDRYQKVINENNRLLSQQAEEIIEQMSVLEARNQEIRLQGSTIEHAYSEIQSSIRYAQRIQRAMLPIRSVLETNFPEHFIFYQPKDIVSGDFYWFKSIGGLFILAVADCTGHGVPGAFMNAIGNTLLNQIVTQETISRPDYVLQLLNNHLSSVFNQKHESEVEIKDGIEIALCTINPAEQKLLFSSARRPLYLVSKGKALQFKGSKLTVDGSSINQKNFGLQIIPFEVSDMMYLFTDGYADQFGGDDYKKFKISELRSTLISISDTLATEQKQLLKHTFDAWKSDYDQIDDVLVVGVRL